PSSDKLYAINSFGIRNSDQLFFSFLRYSELDKNTLASVQDIDEVVDRKRPSAFAFKAAPLPTYQYDWAIDGVADATATTQTVTVEESSVYILNVTDACGSTSEVALTVNVEGTSNTIIDTVITLSPDASYNGIAITGDTTLTETLTSSNGCDSLVMVNVSAMTTSVTETWPQSAIKISPNPTTHTLNLTTSNLEESNIQVYVRDIYGRVLMSSLLRSENMNLDVSNLEAGHYFIEVQAADRRALRRFVKL
ncbi:MAG: T9SS type A sorting domain-containing protein, partial [Bacteroidota bacterium]